MLFISENLVSLINYTHFSMQKIYVLFLENNFTLLYVLPLKQALEH